MKVSVGEQSGQDDYQKDIIKGDNEEESKECAGNFLNTCDFAT